MTRPNPREQAVLKEVTYAGGYHSDLPPDDGVASCVMRGWLLPDGPKRYGITFEGRLVMKPLWN